MTEQDILKALSYVIEPDLKRDLVTLNMVRNIEINGNDISFQIVLTTPACPLKEKIENDAKSAIYESLGNDKNIHIDMISDVLTSSSPSVNPLPSVKNVICVSSGKGGVGKSTISVQLAHNLSQMGAKIGLMDADIHGPSIPTMLGLSKQKPAIRDIKGKTYILPIDYSENLKVLSIGFLVDERQAIVWRGPMVTSALKQFITDVIWGELDYLIVDMPPGTGDVQLTIAQMLNVTGAVVVSTPQTVAVNDARKAISMFRVEGVDIPVAGLVQNMAYFIPDDNPDKKYYIFGQDGVKKLADEYEVPFLGEVPLLTPLRESLDKGEILASSQELIHEHLKTIAQNLAQQISIINNSKMSSINN